MEMLEIERQEREEDEEKEKKKVGVEYKLLESKVEEGEPTYSKLKFPPEDLYASPSPPGLPAADVKGLLRRIRVYRGLSLALAFLSLILLIIVITLSAQRQYHQNRAMEKLSDHCCSQQICKEFYPRDETKMKIVTKESGCQRCSPGWLEFENSCFYLSRERQTWYNSREECRKKGGDLAVVDNGRMQEFLTMNGNLMYWIGLSRSNTGDWVWINQTRLGESYWAPGSQQGNCGYLVGRDAPARSWGISSCTSSTAYICQI